jgi:nitrile hydratase
VESVHGPFRLPDTRALGSSIDWEPVYTVVFEARELWGPKAEPNARVSVDLWQSYLGREDK